MLKNKRTTMSEKCFVCHYLDVFQMYDKGQNDNTGVKASASLAKNKWGKDNCDF